MQEQITTILQDIAGMKEKLSSAHKRIDKAEDVTQHIHRLASNVESLADQIKGQNERMEKMFESLERRLKSQDDRVTALEKEPGMKWKALTAQVVAIIAAVLIGMFISSLLGAPYYYYMRR